MEVIAFMFHQLLIIALLYDFSVIEHDNAIGDLVDLSVIIDENAGCVAVLIEHVIIDSHP